VAGCSRRLRKWGLGHGATASDRRQSRGAGLLKSAEGCLRRLPGAGPGAWPWPRGRGRGTVPLLRIGGDLGRDSRERSRGLLADGDRAGHVLRPCGSRRGHGVWTPSLHPYRVVID
jgi:hypothetical protein